MTSEQMVLPGIFLIAYFASTLAWLIQLDRRISSLQQIAEFLSESLGERIKDLKAAAKEQKK